VRETATTEHIARVLVGERFLAAERNAPAAARGVSHFGLVFSRAMSWSDSMQPVAMTSSKIIRTIADVARLAGVSKSTVSRALSDSPLIAMETKERIRSIAQEHDFQINLPARRLSLKQSRTVALVTYEYKSGVGVPDAFMLEILSGISSGLHSNDYDLLVVNIDPSETDWARRYLESGRVDGFIVLSATCTPQHFSSLVELRAPFIVWGVPIGLRGAYSSVNGDSVAGGRIATEHLLGSGRQRIAFLGGPAKSPEVKARYEGYESALRAAGVEPDPALITHASWSQPDESGAAAMQDLLERAPDLDAVFANSDLLAFAAMQTIRDQGKRIPDDVAVVGYDDVSIARHSDPPLTTVRQNGPLAGRLLAENLIQQIETGALTNVVIPAELVLRESA
jgi:DNA-binding LacI/PurR family transcriptional regulator